MRKFLLLVIVFLGFSSCDDGDIVLKSFDFEDESIQECSGVDSYFLYKIKDNEILIIELPTSVYEANFLNDEATNGTPKVISISSSNQIIYRLYSEDVSSATICSELAPATPIVTKEWTASGGTIQIESIELHENANDPNEVTGYTHNITFKNTNFSNGEESFSFESYIFGDYVTS